MSSPLARRWAGPALLGAALLATACGADATDEGPGDGIEELQPEDDTEVAPEPEDEDGPSDDDGAGDDGEADEGDDGDEPAEDGSAATDPHDGTDELAVDEAPEDAERIDADLVGRVLEVLDERMGEAYAAAADGEFGEDQTVTVLSVYASDLGSSRAGDLRDPEFQDFLADGAGAPVSQVVELRTVGTDCVNAIAERDMSPVFTDPGLDDDLWSVSLVPADGTGNGTAWLIAQEDVEVGEAPEDGCAAGVAS